jgi:hypothetical protein
VVGVAVGAAATGAGVVDGRTSVVRAVQPVTATAAANTNTVMMRAGRMAAFSLMSMTLWVQAISMAGGGHGMTPGGRRGDAGRDSTRSQSAIETNTPPGHEQPLVRP